MMPTHPVAVSPPCPSPPLTTSRVFFIRCSVCARLALKQLPGFIFIPIPPLLESGRQQLSLHRAGCPWCQSLQLWRHLPRAVEDLTPHKPERSRAAPTKACGTQC